VLSKRLSEVAERQDQTEKTLVQLIPAINNGFSQASQQIAAQGEVLEALIALAGKEAVEKVMRANRELRAAENAETEKKALEELVARGEVVAVEKITDKSVIVGREFNPDGSVHHPGRFQLAYQKIDKQFQEQLLGQAAGFTITLPNGGKFEVQEVYQLSDKPPAPVATPSTPEVTAPVVPPTTTVDNQATAP
jgi:hypothetical protein